MEIFIFQMKVEPRAPSPLSSIPAHLQQQAHIQATPPQHMSANHQQGTHPQIQPRVTHKPEPINIHEQMIQV